MINKLRLPRWHEIILEIQRNRNNSRYCQRINKKINGSLTHLRNIVKLLAQRNLIKIIPAKKIKRLELTDKGSKVASAIIALKTELK